MSIVSGRHKVHTWPSNIYQPCCTHQATAEPILSQVHAWAHCHPPSEQFCQLGHEPTGLMPQHSDRDLYVAGSWQRMNTYMLYSRQRHCIMLPTSQLTHSLCRHTAAIIRLGYCPSTVFRQQLTWLSRTSSRYHRMPHAPDMYRKACAHSTTTRHMWLCTPPPRVSVDSASCSNLGLGLLCRLA
jgi:hypothetical protein